MIDLKATARSFGARSASATNASSSSSKLAASCFSRSIHGSMRATRCTGSPAAACSSAEGIDGCG